VVARELVSGCIIPDWNFSGAMFQSGMNREGSTFSKITSVRQAGDRTWQIISLNV
jgi:hypothetical protein